MKIVTIAALAAAQLLTAGASARAAEPIRDEPAAQTLRAEDSARTPVLLASRAQAAPDAADREDRPRKKRKSTGDKVLTGAAVVLGVGALAVGGLLIVIFAN
jgi:Flp pilus assembly protein TadB